MFYTQWHYGLPRDGPCNIWCPHNLFPHGYCKVGGSASELICWPWLSGGLSFDQNHLVGSYHNNTNRGTKCVEICLDLPRGGGLQLNGALLSYCSNTAQLVSTCCDCFPSSLNIIWNNITKYGQTQHIQHGQVNILLLRLMTHTMQCVFAAILLRFHIACRLTHWMWICSENCKHKWKPSVYMWGNSSHFCVAKTLSMYVEKCSCTINHVCAKNCLHIQFMQLLSLQVFYNGRSINQPCASVPCSVGQAGCHVQREQL